MRTFQRLHPAILPPRTLPVFLVPFVSSFSTTSPCNQFPKKRQPVAETAEESGARQAKITEEESAAPEFPTLSEIKPEYEHDPKDHAARRRVPRLLRRVPVRPASTTEYNPPAPPRSPYADPNLFKTYAEKHPKAPPIRLDSASVDLRTLQLYQNPYARILASPVRADTDLGVRIPSDLLTRFIIRKHPEVGDNWLLPDGIEKKTRPRSHQSTYALGTISSLQNYTARKGLEKKLVPVLERQSFTNIVWRGDMPMYVCDKLRRRVMAELSAALSPKIDRIAMTPGWELFVQPESRGLFSEDTRELRQVEMPVMSSAVLDFGIRAKPADPPELSQPLRVKFVEKGQKRPRQKGEPRQKNLVPVPSMAPEVDRSLLMAGDVLGKNVPVHPMRAMLGAEKSQELLEVLRANDERLRDMGDAPRILLMSTMRTVAPAQWLMRLRAYLELWYLPPGAARRGADRREEESLWGVDVLEELRPQAGRHVRRGILRVFDCEPGSRPAVVRRGESGGIDAETRRKIRERLKDLDRQKERGPRRDSSWLKRSD